MTTLLKIKIVLISCALLFVSCREDQRLLPEGIYGHPGDEDDQFEVPDNLTPIDFSNGYEQSRRTGT